MAIAPDKAKYLARKANPLARIYARILKNRAEIPTRGVKAS
jgi:hypothetical protein